MILTDLGTQFNSEVFHCINKNLGIFLTHNSSKHPQANGATESLNRAIKSSILTLHEAGVSFKNSLLIHQNLYNNAVHPSTSFEPVYLHFGRCPPTMFDTFDPNIEPQQLDKASFSQNFISDLRITYDIAFNKLKEQQILQNQKQIQKAKLRNFNANDIVYMRSNDTFKPKFLGPYVIVKKQSDVNFKITPLDTPSHKGFVIHSDRLRLAPRRLSHLDLNYSPSPPINNPFHGYNLRAR
ncbi:uncharacterized protein [Parasteatoda tepidariorum]|uniref:uncharacterized protein n=1 Tax=Parasteatoda tepidariorum TaxID=114398 RepID=UPI001C71F4D1|nr:uncharacterized protein LOC107453682 [Parasteatoda tepidariorum]